MSEPKKTSKRRPGRPRKLEAPVTPEVKEEISRLWLSGKSDREIGLAIGLAQSTVQHHLQHTIKPLWRNSIEQQAAYELARADLIIRLAFEGFDRSLKAQTTERKKWSTRPGALAKAQAATARKIKRKAPRATEQLVERTLEMFERDGDRGWLELVATMMDFKARIKGLYAPTRHRIEETSELRVAGLTPAQLEQKMLDRVADLVLERRRHQQIMRDAYGEAAEN